MSATNPGLGYARFRILPLPSACAYITRAASLLFFTNTTPLHTMSNATLKSFDPFATHPFTNSQGLQKEPPHPQTYSNRSAAPSSLPTQQTPAPIHSPMPRQATQHQQQKPIFTPFHKDRASPDLPVDALMKKSTSTQWGRSPR